MTITASSTGSRTASRSFLSLVERNAAAFAVAFLFLAPAQAADPTLCAACHGEAGNSANPAVPSLAQQPAQFISTSLFMFREGNRKDPQMSPMAEKLNNAGLNDLRHPVSQ